MAWVANSVCSLKRHAVRLLLHCCSGQGLTAQTEVLDGHIARLACQSNPMQALVAAYEAIPEL